MEVKLIFFSFGHFVFSARKAQLTGKKNVSSEEREAAVRWIWDALHYFVLNCGDSFVHKVRVFLEYSM